LGAIAYFILPFDFIRTCCRCSFTDDAAVLATAMADGRGPTSRPNIATPPAPR